MDNLSKCAMAAQRAGMSYGKYMAKFGSRNILTELEKQDPEAVPCKYCGKLFVPRMGNVKYCSDECSRERDRERKLDYYRRVRDGVWTPASGVGEAAICRICGMAFVKKVSHQVYCGPECARIANLQGAKRNKR